MMRSKTNTTNNKRWKDLRHKQMLLNETSMCWTHIYRKIKERECEISTATCSNLTVILIYLRIYHHVHVVFVNTSLVIFVDGFCPVFYGVLAFFIYLPLMLYSFMIMIISLFFCIRKFLHSKVIE
jgi:hypothetical protein